MLDSVNKGMRVKQVYTELDRKYEEEETEKSARDQRIAYINLYGFPPDELALKLLSKTDAEIFQAVVFSKDGKNAKLGTPKFTAQTKKAIGNLQAQGLIVEPYLISQSSFDHMMQGYSRMVEHIAKNTEEIRLSSSDQRFTQGSLKLLGQRLTEVSVTTLIEELLGSALHLDSSDIHIEPEKSQLKIRFRIDGVLMDVVSLDLQLQRQLTSRIKLLAKLKLNVTTLPQDGSFSLTYDNLPVDVRVSVLPSAFGESIVMRLLRQDKNNLKFEELGITGLALEKITAEMNRPNGMILTTGPTGSGKTTTLYAILNKLNEPGVKIITLEDPVEYKIEGITQTPIDVSAGLTFAQALRSVMRQDPDIVMVGEMRDLETAEIGCQAALTGHVVLSTLHTNDAPAAIPRLMDLGVKPFVLAPAINAIVGQRLVRKLCVFCKEPYSLPLNLQSRVEMILRAVPRSAKVDLTKKLAFYHSRGCPKCHGLGYSGRIGVYEVFVIDDEIEKMISKSATTSGIKKQAIESGMLTMAQDGLLKALQGITDVEEVFRVTEE